MAYDENLAARIRALLDSDPSVTERKMFGGIAFMINGNMCCGVAGEDLMLRVGAAEYEAALARPNARPMDFTGRPMKGMVFVGAAGTRTAKSLETWVARAFAFASSLPPK
jgi:TfoX/Sxy family transcriptional regulator of competence genes